MNKVALFKHSSNINQVLAAYIYFGGPDHSLQRIENYSKEWSVWWTIEWAPLQLFSSFSRA